VQFRLLIDLEAIEYLETFDEARRKKFLDHFHRIQEFPGHYSDLIHLDDAGRRLDIAFYDRHAIYYWTDAADRHVKILKIAKVD
jgi:hypothetical protein